MRVRLVAALAAILSLVSTGDSASPLDRADVDMVACSHHDRECLYAFMDLYLEALSDRNPSRLPLGEDVKFTENDRLLEPGQGVWQTARGITGYQIYAADTKNGQVGFIGVLETDDRHSLYSVRLKVRGHAIREIETLFPGATVGGFLDDRLLEIPAELVTARPGYRVPLPPRERVSREKLQQAADSYYNGIEAGSGDIVAFSDRCHRIENGYPLVNNPGARYPRMITANGELLDYFSGMGCREQFNTNVWSTDSIGDRRYPLIDEEYGIVFAYTLYHRFSKERCIEIRDHGRACVPEEEFGPATLALLEAFKIRNGKIHEMESVWPILPDNRQADHWP